MLYENIAVDQERIRQGLRIMGGSTQKIIRLQAVIIKDGLWVAVEQQAWKAIHPDWAGPEDFKTDCTFAKEMWN